MYPVRTIGDLSGPLAGQTWPDIPPGWVPAGAPGIAGTPAPVPGPPRPPTVVQSTDGPVLVAVALGAIALTCAGFWAWSKWR